MVDTHLEAFPKLSAKRLFAGQAAVATLRRQNMSGDQIVLRPPAGDGVHILLYPRRLVRPNDSAQRSSRHGATVYTLHALPVGDLMGDGSYIAGVSA